MIRQVVYLSTAQGAVDDEALDGILRQARSGNGPRGITGLMAFGGGLFLQILEGPRDTVEAVLVKIKRDARHGQVRILQDQEVALRDFAGCPMGFRTLDPDAARLIAARTRVEPMSVRDIAVMLGDASLVTTRLPMAA